MNLAVRWARPADAEDLALVLREMAAHYRQQPLTQEATVAAARDRLAKDSPAYPHFAMALRAGTRRRPRLGGDRPSRHRPEAADVPEGPFRARGFSRQRQPGEKARLEKVLRKLDRM